MTGEDTRFIICEDYLTMIKSIGECILKNVERIIDLNITELEKDTAYEIYYTDDNSEIHGGEVVRKFFVTSQSSLLKFCEEN